MTDIVQKLREHGKVFHDMSERHLRHHYEDVRERGLQHALLANALHGGADEIEQLRTALRGLRDAYWCVTDSLGLSEHVTGQIANAMAAADAALNIQQRASE